MVYYMSKFVIRVYPVIVGQHILRSWHLHDDAIHTQTTLHIKQLPNTQHTTLFLVSNIKSRSSYLSELIDIKQLKCLLLRSYISNHT